MRIKRLKENEIEKVMLFAKKVYTQKEWPINISEDKADWISRFNNQGILIGAFVGNELKGFIFGHETENINNGYLLWRTGVSKDIRRKGIFSLLMTNIQSILSEKKYKKIVVSTYKDRFPIMHDYLVRHGYKILKIEERELGKKRFKKSYFVKKL